MRLPILILLLSCWLSAAWAAPRAELWQRWTAHDPASTIAVDHGAWERFLERHLVVREEVNLLDYAGVDPAGYRNLTGYLGYLAGVPVSHLSRDRQLAYWINLYNALTVKVVLDHYPVESIRDIDISPGLFSDGPWGKKLIRVEGQSLSLDDIEHRILRPIWQDPRIHYAVNCASIGCPSLAPEPFTATNAATLLDRKARRYINDPRGVAFKGGELVVSSLYHWFEEDFGGSEAGVLDHLRRYASGPLRARLEDMAGYHRHRYDWSLNDMP
ncbi:MAG: DUF547 domain-containing protein [Candidatus Competibacteraceae bacterium]|nr:DUF547 domain-containing protein [Candidatus Competibacteraceae bacterium]